MTSRFKDHILGPDTHANLPTATAVPAGAMYECTTHGRIYRNSGTAWSTYAQIVPNGGTTGQALIKNSSTDGDVSWGTAGGGSSISVKDYSEDNTTISISSTTPTNIFSRTITAAATGTYLITADWWLWSGTQQGSVDIVVDGTALTTGRTDSARGTAPFSRHTHALASHTSGNLTVALRVTSEGTGTVQFGVGTDPRYGRHVTIIGPL